MLKKLFFGLSILLFIGQIHAQKSLKFDGVNDVVQISGYKGISGTTARTVEGWIKIPKNTTNCPMVYWGVNTASQKWVFRTQTTSGTVGGNLRVECNGGFITGSTDLRDNKWHHVAVTWANDGTPSITDALLYVDGVLETTNASLSWAVNTASSLDVQLGIDQNSNRFEGEMDEFRIWNAVLSVTELRDWMCKELSTNHPKYSNLQAYWKMDTLLGTMVKDFSVNSRNGTIQNGATWQNYGGPIGNVSINRYSSSTPISLKHPNGDSVIVSNWAGNPQGIHLYRRDSEPNNKTLPSVSTAMDSSRHWGVFMAKGNSPTYKIDYFYSPNKHYLKYGACSNYLLARNDNSVTSWTATSASNLSGVFGLNSQKESEFMIGYGVSGVRIYAPNNKDTAAICSGDSITLNNSTSGFNYQWYKNGNAITGATSGFLKTSDSGLFSLIITGGACKDTSNTLTILNKANPIVNMSPYSPVCESVFSIPFAGGSPAGGTYSSQFTSGNDFIVKSAGPGSHKITYEFTDQFGCSDTASKFLEVLNLPAVTLAKKADVCVDSSVHNLTGGSPIGGNYFVNGVPTNSFDASALGVGKHWIKYIYTDSNNCINADSNEAEILVLPRVSLSLIKKSYCEYDEDGVLDGQNPSGGTFYGNGVNGFNFSPNASGVGNHEIRYVVTDGITGCKNTARDTIIVSARPSKPVITVVGDSLKINPEFDHRWYTEKGGIAGETQSFYIPKKEDNYFARVMNKEGCWSLNSDTIVYRFTSLSNELPNHDKIVFFPNPAKEYVQFLTNDNSIYQLNIISMNGAIVFSGSTTESQKIDLSKIEGGIYSMQIVDDLGRKSTYKLVISN